MGFPWTTILQWVLPTIPELISTVRNMKKQPQLQQAAREDLIGRIEQMEKTLELQSQINTALTLPLQQFQRRLQVLTFVAIFALVLAMFGCAAAIAAQDVATARTESYEYPTALPTVEPSSIKQDLYRRDFTINTMAVRLNARNFGELIDFYGGRRDLKEKTLRVLHNVSFLDDPTRIFRAIRFEQRFGFHLSKHSVNTAGVLAARKPSVPRARKMYGFISSYPPRHLTCQSLCLSV